MLASCPCMRTTESIDLRNQRSIRVSACTSSTDMPSRNACAIAKMRSGVAFWS